MTARHISELSLDIADELTEVRLEKIASRSRKIGTAIHAATESADAFLDAMNKAFGSIKMPDLHPGEAEKRP